MKTKQSMTNPSRSHPSKWQIVEYYRRKTTIPKCSKLCNNSFRYPLLFTSFFPPLIYLLSLLSRATVRHGGVLMFLLQQGDHQNRTTQNSQNQQNQTTKLYPSSASQQQTQHRSISPTPLTHSPTQPMSLALASQALGHSQSFSIATHSTHSSSSRLLNPASTELYHKQVSIIPPPLTFSLCTLLPLPLYPSTPSHPTSSPPSSSSLLLDLF